MRILQIVPTYPGDPLDGSAVYQRNLNRALHAAGAEISVFTTTAARRRHDHPFAIRWPDELPASDEHEGVSITRFPALDLKAGALRASMAVLRRWSHEDFREGALMAGSRRYTDVAVAQARRRPRRYDNLADLARGPLSPGLLGSVRRHLRDFDVVLAGYAPFSLGRQALKALAGTGMPVALLPFIHENDRYHLFASLLDTYAQADVVLTLSPHTADFLSRHVPEARAVVLGAGVDPAREEMSGDTFRRRHDLGDGPVVLYVGRKEAGKRYEMAVEAVDQLEGRATLVMVGRDVDGKRLRSHRVRQLGPLPAEELHAAYAACDVFLFPSTFESFGMVFLDAWSHGRPVIGNANCGASAALIDDGVDGLLCGEASGMAAAIRSLIDDRDLAARMGAAGREKVRRTYTWGQVGTRALHALEAITSARDARGSTARRRYVPVRGCA